MTRTALDVARIRADFPALAQRVYDHPLVYLDSAASAQKPAAVIEAVAAFDRTSYANIHRGVHALSRRATEAYEGARGKVARFLGAASEREILFLRGTTEAINLVVSTCGRQRVGPGDEVLISAMEHHSGIVPWQMLCEEKGARLRIIPMTDRGELVMEEAEKLLGPRTKFVSLVHVSNALGTINPVRRVTEMAHACGALVLLDGAQAVPHMPVDVAAIGCDFYAFSGHKVFAPSGIGALWAREALLEEMPPWQGGGDMIASVTFEKTTYNKVPHKFEAGTPNITGAVGLGAAIDYVSAIGMDRIQSHERELLAHATRRVSAVEGVRLIGTSDEKAGVLSFLVEGVHPHDVGTILDRRGIAVRTGHHCAQPVMERLGIPATTRASFAVYNTREDADALAEALGSVREIFA